MDMEMEKITNTELNVTQWTQESLPINVGGLDIRSFLEISLPTTSLLFFSE